MYLVPKYILNTNILEVNTWREHDFPLIATHEERPFLAGGQPPK